MNRPRLVKPSLMRAMLSIVLLTALTCFVTGISLAIAYTHGLSDPAPTSEYIRLFTTFIVLWGPTYLLFFWWATVPALVGLGVLLAAVRGEQVDTF